MYLPKFTDELRIVLRHHDDGTHPNDGFLFIGTQTTKFLSAYYARFEVSSKGHRTKRKDAKCSKETESCSYELFGLNSLLSMRNRLVLVTLATSVLGVKLSCCSVFANRYS